MQHFYPLTVAAIEPQTRDAVAVTFDLPPALREPFCYRQGQHLTLRREIEGADIRRSYSICAGAQERRLRVAVKRVAGGLFSNWVNDHLAPGMTIEVLPPAGNFRSALDAGHAKHYLAFAAGSGITPILSLLKTTLEAEPRSRFTLVYGNRSAASVLFKEELEDLKDVYLERLRLVFILSREELDIELFHGRIDRDRADALLRRWLDPADIDMAFVCGPLDMMTGVRDALLDHGVARARIKLELFATSARDAAQRQARQQKAQMTAAAGESEISVVLDGRTRGFTLARGGANLLEAALARSLELPYSCKSGVCSSCRCKVVAGEVEMHSAHALEDYEIARGFVLACQSYPVSDRVVLDFDQQT